MTPEGEKSIEMLAAWMLDNKEIPSMLYTGPRTRTFQTAEILRTEIGLPKPVVEDALAPDKGNALGVLIKRLLADPSSSKVALVSDHDTIAKGLAYLVSMKSEEYERMAMGEMRVLKADRKDGYWREKNRIMPSDHDLTDHY